MMLKKDREQKKDKNIFLFVTKGRKMPLIDIIHRKRL